MTGAFDGLSELDDSSADSFAAALFQRHRIDTDDFDPDEFVALLFVDGMCGCEERVSSALASGLRGVRLAGGSAGDDLAFERTSVIFDGTARSDRATLVLARSQAARFRVFKHQHFKTEPQMLAVTRADPHQRRVYEFDGYPAAQAYAAALGMDPGEMTTDSAFAHPVIFRCNGSLYVRSIQAINTDGSISFYCSIEEGMVLQLGGHLDMTEELQTALTPDDESVRADFILGFNCVLRALEATQSDAWDKIGCIVSSASRSSIGFDTYGEQLNGLHINQTLVAVAMHHATRP